jgi:hypothetical protein
LRKGLRVERPILPEVLNRLGNCRQSKRRKRKRMQTFGAPSTPRSIRWGSSAISRAGRRHIGRHKKPNDLAAALTVVEQDIGRKQQAQRAVAEQNAMFERQWALKKMVTGVPKKEIGPGQFIYLDSNGNIINPKMVADNAGGLSDAQMAAQGNETPGLNEEQARFAGDAPIANLTRGVYFLRPISQPGGSAPGSTFKTSEPQGCCAARGEPRRVPCVTCCVLNTECILLP